MPPENLAAGQQSEPLAEMSRHISKAGVLIGLYQKHANMEIRGAAELDHVQREMAVIKSEIISELSHSRSLLQGLQKASRG